MGFNIVLYSSTLFFSDSCEFLPSNQYILLNLSPKWLRLYISLPVQLSVEMHTEIFGNGRGASSFAMITVNVKQK